MGPGGAPGSKTQMTVTLSADGRVYDSEARPLLSSRLGPFGTARVAGGGGSPISCHRWVYVRSPVLMHKPGSPDPPPSPPHPWQVASQFLAAFQRRMAAPFTLYQ